MNDVTGVRRRDSSAEMEAVRLAKSRPIRVLIADDEPPLRRSLSRMLRGRGMFVVAVPDGAEALEQLSAAPFDVALIDLRMPKLDGFELLGEVKARELAAEVILMTAFADVETAVKAVQGGAYHFLTKPFRSNDEVALTVSKAAERRRLLDRTVMLERALVDRDGFGALIGTSTKMQEVYRLAKGVAPTTSTVLILGESGTGKELTARAIHQHSLRAQSAFVPVNCSAIPENLVESELFGHVRGAFTGATQSRQGLFEAAHNGTIFLDEIGDLPLHAQVKLLRTLQEGEIKPVGSDAPRSVDVRVVAATNVNLRDLIEQGRFREDLFYRLNVIAIELPPLRERENDLLLLAQHFLQKYAERQRRGVDKISADAVKLLRAHTWPGNVRELENAMEHAVIFSKGEEVEPTALPFELASMWPGEADTVAAGTESEDFSRLPYKEAKQRALERFERAYFTNLLDQTDGNMSEAARRAGLDRSNFRRAAKRVVASPYRVVSVKP